MRLKSSLIACALVLQMLAAVFAAGQTSRSTSSERANAKNVVSNNGQGSSEWPMYGRDLAGSHYNPTEKIITPATVARLKPKWIFETGDDVSSQPTVVGGVIYFGSYDGKEYAVDAKTGAKIWE